MTINYTNKTIEMTKAEEKAASKYGSDMYNDLKAARADFPTFRVVVKATPKKKGSFKGLTYDFMEQYISEHDETGEIKKEFDLLRGKVDEFTTPATYGQIKKWFLAKYPALTAGKEEAENILKAAA